MAISGSARALATVVAAGAAAATVAACSSSSSGGAGTTPSAPASAAIAAEHSPSAPAETFKHVTAKQADNLENVLPLERGVQSDVYYPDTKKFVVTYTSNARKIDQQNVEDLVRQAKEGRKLKPPKPTASSSPSQSVAPAAATPTPTFTRRHHAAPPRHRGNRPPGPAATSTGSAHPNR